MRYFFFFLLAAAPARADESLLVKFVAFQGVNCGYDKSQAALYVDRATLVNNRWNEQPAWRTLDAKALRESQPLDISATSLPADATTRKLTFRFYALHNEYSADHYVSDLKLTVAFLKTLPQNQPVTKTLDLSPTFEVGNRRQCKLVLELTREAAAEAEPSPDAGVNGTAK